MKNFIFLLFTLILIFASTSSCSSDSSIPCENIMDCPHGYYCSENQICIKGETPWELPDGSVDSDISEDGDIIDSDVDSEIQPDVGPPPDADIIEPDGTVANCSFVPTPGQFTPVQECRWNEPLTFPAYDDSVMTPVVANMTDDNNDGIVNTLDTPDIIFVSYRREDGCCNVPGVLRVVSGKCDENGHLPEHFSIFDPHLDNSGGVAVGDIDGDDIPDIVAMQRTSGTVAYDNQGNIKWTSPHPQGEDILTAAQPAIDDLDFDGLAEIIIGRIVLDGSTGELKWRGTHGIGINAFMGPMSFAADIDLDGRKEVIAGNTVYRANGELMWQFNYPSASSPCNSQGMPCDGYAAAGNFDLDPYAEIVIVRSGDVWFLEHEGTLITKIPIPWDNCSYNEGGPPTIADFDNDGRAEVGVAGADFYAVIDLDCCNSLSSCDATPAGNPHCSGPGIRWHIPNQDCSSRVTGSSVFDFDGDGSAEVVYNDEQKFRIFSGMDGTILFEEANGSHTRLEYPIIADVDNDGNAEIVFIENNSSSSNLNRGIEVWGDSGDRWVPTRRIWNQHSYYISNINEDGTIPQQSTLPNWLVYNNDLKNMPDYNVFAAPDLQIEIDQVNKENCNSAIDIIVEVCNQGDLRVGAGVNIGFWNLETASELDCASAVTTSFTLEPGNCEFLTCTWENPPSAPDRINLRACVDNDLPSCNTGGSNNECIEDNNLDTVDVEGCDGPIGK
jgi:hypothetical protein